MMVRLPLESFSLVRPMMCRPHLDLVAAAMEAWNSPYEAWVDNAEGPAVAFVWDGAHCYFLLGAPSDAATRAFADLLGGEIRDTAIERDRTFFKLYTDGDWWNAHLPSVLPGVSLRKLERIFLALDAPRLAAWRESVPDGLGVRRIDRELLFQGDLRHMDDLTGEILSMWGSSDAFLESGFGRCAVTGDAVAGWCTSEYHSPGRCGIGVETVEEFQRRGIATVLAAAVAEDSVQAGVRPHWDSWLANVPSVRVAEKVGYVPVEQYWVHVGSWDE